MTEAQAIAKAWYEIADAYYTPRDERTEAQLSLARTGCCNATGILETRGDISYSTEERMDDIIAADIKELGIQLGGQCYYFCDLFDPDSDILRADYCELQACIAEEERDD